MESSVINESTETRKLHHEKPQPYQSETQIKENPVSQYNGKSYGLALNATYGLNVLNLPRMTLAQAMAYRETAALVPSTGAGVVVVNLDSVQ